MQSLRERVLAGHKLSGTHASLVDPAICEMLGLCGFDYLWIDLEHSWIDVKSLLIHLNAARSAGTCAIVRVPENDYVTLKKVLEIGPDGVIFPMIRSFEQAKSLIDATLYPPRGTRGFGPKRAIRYGQDDVNTYIHEGSRSMCRFIQIEHVDAVNCLDQLLTIEEIDGFIIGPCDLSGSLGELNNVFGDRNLTLIQQIIARVKAAGKATGVSFGAYDEQTVRRWHDMGFDLISLGGDAEFIMNGARAAIAPLRAFHSM